MEKAHLQFIKYSLGVHKKASNVGSWGETGRYPLGITILHISTTWHRKEMMAPYFSMPLPNKRSLASPGTQT